MSFGEVTLTLVLIDTYITLMMWIGHDTDRSLTETVTYKIRKYHSDYNNNPPNSISFMSMITSTSERLHSEFVCLLFLQPHRETSLFFAVSGVHLPQHHRDQFHFRCVFSSQFKSKIGNILDKTAELQIILNIDGEPVVSRSHTHPSHS